MAASAGASEEEKAVIELQERVLVGAQTLNRLTQQDKAAVMRKTRLELTVAELTALPDGVSVYRSVGKAYFASSKEQVVADAKATISDLAAETETLRKQKGAVEQKYLEAQNEFKELLQGLRALKA